MLFEQGVALPDIIPGCAGGLMITAGKVCFPDDPQVLLASTVISPPERPAIALIVFVLELPDHPFGKDQV